MAGGENREENYTTKSRGGVASAAAAELRSGSSSTELLGNAQLREL